MSSLDLWQELRGSESAGRLTGREQRLKDPGRIEARVAEDMRVKGRTAREALTAITDRIRFSFCYPSDGYLPGIRADAAELRSRGFTEVERRNLWEAAVRLGTVSVWRAPAAVPGSEPGELFEVQFHTALSQSVRERSFPLYARLRSAEPGDATRTELQALSRALCWSGPADPGTLADLAPRPGGMPHRVAYYAIIDALSSREAPAGVLRRVMHPDGQRDEAFGHDLAWRHTFMLYSAERGNLDNKLRQISGIEAARIVGRVRETAAAAAAAAP
jgi:hypothetical protein